MYCSKLKFLKVVQTVPREHPKNSMSMEQLSMDGAYSIHMAFETLLTQFIILERINNFLFLQPNIMAFLWVQWKVLYILLIRTKIYEAKQQSTTVFTPNKIETTHCIDPTFLLILIWL